MSSYAIVGMDEEDSADSKVEEELKAELIRGLKKTYNSCEKCGLRMSAMAISKLLEALDKDLTNYELKHELQTLNTRIRDELSFVEFFYVPEDRAAYYANPLLFGEKVIHSFPSSAYDIEEAGNCIALERPTACVFHLMRSLETPLTLLATELGIEFSPNWNKYLEQVDKIAKDIREGKIEKPENWKDREKFYSEACGLLRNVKNAWRNEVMHLEKKYTPEEALRIYNATKGFMEFLATHLAEKQDV